MSDAVLDSVFYLYPSHEAAERGVGDAAGTGFFIGVPSRARQERWYPFAVSVRHVTPYGISQLIRVNRHDGGVSTMETEPDAWHFRPQHDLALAPVPLDLNIHKARLMCVDEYAITRDAFLENDIGPGDEVFMVGRFLQHDGGLTNLPSARFRNTSMRLPHIPNPD